ncbi:hypothetical protein OF83DRAFT_1080342 [Amylostereum chailletii]|nr:hypothetical protein OF83DRAFT_1080342 [Amylostereum chailletii]
MFVPLAIKDVYKPGNASDTHSEACKDDLRSKHQHRRWNCQASTNEYDGKEEGGLLVENWTEDSDVDDESESKAEARRTLPHSEARLAVRVLHLPNHAGKPDSPAMALSAQHPTTQDYPVVYVGTILLDPRDQTNPGMTSVVFADARCHRTGCCLAQSFTWVLRHVLVMPEHHGCRAVLRLTHTLAAETYTKGATDPGDGRMANGPPVPLQRAPNALVLLLWEYLGRGTMSRVLGQVVASGHIFVTVRSDDGPGGEDRTGRGRRMSGTKEPKPEA